MATFETYLTGSVSYEGIAEAVGKIKASVADVVSSTVKETAREILHDAVAKSYAGGSSSMSYTRTGEIVDAVTVEMKGSSGRMVSFEVKIDGARLTPMVLNDKKQLNPHASVSGSAFTTPLPYVLNYGSSGSPIHNHPGTHFMEDAFTTMTSELILVLADGLKARGFEVEIG